MLFDSPVAPAVYRYMSALIGFTPAQVSYTMYSASKGFLINFSRGIFQDARRAGVTVQAVCPGFTLVEGSKDHSRRLYPRVLWMTTEQTVAAALAARHSGKCIVIPGARNRLLLELDENGRMTAQRVLERLRHPQAEGVAVMPNGALVVADEAGDSGGPGRLTVYPIAGP